MCSSDLLLLCVCVCVCVCGENVYFLTIEYFNDDVLDFNIKFTITVTRGGGKGGLGGANAPPASQKFLSTSIVFLSTSIVYSTSNNY